MGRTSTGGGNAKEQSTAKGSKGSSDKTKSLDKTEEFYASLPKLEIVFYAAFLIWSYSTIIYQFCKLSKKREPDLLKYGYIDEGWSILNRGQDSDFEWSYWRDRVTKPMFLGCMAAYVILSRAVEMLIPKQREICIAFACLAFLFTTYDWTVIAALVVQTVFTYLISRTRMKSIIWISAVLQMTLFNIDYFEENLLDPIFEHHNVEDLTFLSALCLLKFISFSLECCDVEKLPSCPETGRKQDTLYDLFVYNFYFPQFMIGPIYIYSKWRVDMNQPVNAWDRQKYSRCFWEGLHYLGWMLVIEVALHYSYHPSLSFDPITIRLATFSETAGYAMCCLLYFQMKYMSIYGFPRILCLLDGVDSPKPPMCIHAMYTFKDMWRYFDRGLHEFLVRYIYIPIGGSKAGILRQQLAGVSCFALVCFWHGGKQHLIIWAVTNWLGLTIESIVEVVAKATMSGCSPSWISGAMKRRAIAVFRGVMYLGLVPSNMYFLTGTTIATSITKKVLLSGNILHPFLSFYFFYCITQMLLEVYHAWGRRHICNKNYYYLGSSGSPKEKTL